MKETVTIYCKNTKTYQKFPVGTTLLDMYKSFGEPLQYCVMNAHVNNRVEGLKYRCYQPKDIEFNDYTATSGQRAYIRSLCHIFAKAVAEIMPTAKLHIEHPLSKGYYCTIQGGGEVTPKLILQIKQRMSEIVAENSSFHFKQIQTTEAAELFRSQGMDDKALLIETAGMLYTTYYDLEGSVNYFYGCLVPYTGYIHLFNLIPHHEGILLQIPNRNNPELLDEFVDQEKMFDVFKEHRTMQRTIGLNYVGDFNKVTQEKRTTDIIKVSEAIQEKSIAKIAEQIASRFKEGVRLVLISGPSSSGKTTMCKRLEIQLITNLLHPVSISLDDYFLDREDTPKDEDGEYDFESLYTLDLQLFNSDLKRVIAGEEVRLPTFSFETGKRIYRGNTLKMQSNSILVIEGIHALNPELTALIDPQCTFKIYVSALTTISLDSHNWIPTTDNRLIRRIVRDYGFRGYSAKETIARWESVRKGEEKWIFPYQEHADVMFNSAMLYELAALRRVAEPILMEVLESDKEHAEAFRLLRFLRYFNYIPDDEYPRTSLLREFLGGSSFTY
jgi:uridine kinase